MTDQPAAEVKLEPCPFCGGPAEIVPDGAWNMCRVGYCGHCEIKGPLESNEEMAIAAWNLRAQPASETKCGGQIFGIPCELPAGHESSHQVSLNKPLAVNEIPPSAQPAAEVKRYRLCYACGVLDADSPCLHPSVSKSMVIAANYDTAIQEHQNLVNVIGANFGCVKTPEAVIDAALAIKEEYEEQAATITALTAERDATREAVAVLREALTIVQSTLPHIGGNPQSVESLLVRIGTAIASTKQRGET